MAIFNLNYSIKNTDKKFSLSVSFYDGDEEYYDITSFAMFSKGDKICICFEGGSCCEAYNSYLCFDRKDLNIFLEQLRQKGFENIDECIHAVPSCQRLHSGKSEDLYREGFKPDSVFDSVCKPCRYRLHEIIECSNKTQKNDYYFDTKNEALKELHRKYRFYVINWNPEDIVSAIWKKTRAGVKYTGGNRFRWKITPEW